MRQSAWAFPIDRLVIATNDNDILARTFASGVYETRAVVATTSPSMDIQLSSNFERLLFEAAGRDAGTVRRYMDGLKQSGSFAIEAAQLARLRAEFSAGRADDGRGRRDDPAAACRHRLPARSAHRDGRPCRR